MHEPTPRETAATLVMPQTGPRRGPFSSVHGRSLEHAAHGRLAAARTPDQPPPEPLKNRQAAGRRSATNGHICGARAIDRSQYAAAPAVLSARRVQSAARRAGVVRAADVEGRKCLLVLLFHFSLVASPPPSIGVVLRAAGCLTRQQQAASGSADMRMDAARRAARGVGGRGRLITRAERSVRELRRWLLRLRATVSGVR